MRYNGQPMDPAMAKLRRWMVLGLALCALLGLGGACEGTESGKPSSPHADAGGSLDGSTGGSGGRSGSGGGAGRGGTGGTGGRDAGATVDAGPDLDGGSDDDAGSTH